MIEHFHRMMAYELWANARVNESLRSADAALQHEGASAAAASFVRAGEIWAHVQAARRIWLHRVGLGDPPPDGLFPRWPVDRAVAECAAMDTAWNAYIATLAPPDLARVVTYATTEGARKTNALADILTHVFNHSTYHRGQIARLVSECGGTRADTDFILFARKDA